MWPVSSSWDTPLILTNQEANICPIDIETRLISCDRSRPPFLQRKSTLICTLAVDKTQLDLLCIIPTCMQQRNVLQSAIFRLQRTWEKFSSRPSILRTSSTLREKILALAYTITMTPRLQGRGKLSIHKVRLASSYPRCLTVRTQRSRMTSLALDTIQTSSQLQPQAKPARWTHH